MRHGRAFPSRRDEHSVSRLLASFLDATVAVTGTATASITEADVVTGGKTIILTLTNEEWVTAGANFDAQRQNIINGLDSAQAEATGWDAVVKAGLVVANVIRTSATVVTITMPAFATYDITATETITATVPSTALLTNMVAVVGSPTFTVSAVGVAASNQHQPINAGLINRGLVSAGLVN
jgi:hypothetical protein